MVTLLAGLMGFASSTVPELLNIWNEKKDRQHELAILDRQMEANRLGHHQRLDEINAEFHIRESEALLKHDMSLVTGTWVDSLRASVRPLITYAFFGLFAAIKLCALYILVIEEGIPVYQALPKIWDIETHALFSATISFWFGSRSMSKLRGVSQA